MNTFFRYSFFLFLPLLLAGCFGGDDENINAVDDSGLLKHVGTGYSIRVPASWEKLDPTKIVAPVQGTIELVMRSFVNKRGFMNNLVILSDTLEADATASEYVSQSMLWAAREYISLSVENQEQMTFADGENSRLVIFRAKYNEVTEEHLFLQTARICGKKVYLMTIGLENDTEVNSYDRYRSILKSFTCL